MVKSEHIKVIAIELEKLGSKLPENLDMDSDHSLANILSLACGGGSYQIEPEKLIQIRTEEFAFDEKSVKALCERSATR